MSDLSGLTDEELKKSFGRSIDNERKATNIVLLHLREIEKRKIFSREGDSSLVAFCVRKPPRQKNSASNSASNSVSGSEVTFSSSTSSKSVPTFVPFSQGGDNDSSNLRLLCREHNQLMAVELFGIDKMQPHLPSLR